MDHLRVRVIPAHLECICQVRVRGKRILWGSKFMYIISWWTHPESIQEVN